jgi:hypothetical protein
MPITRVFEKMESAVNGAGAHNGVEFAAGVNRCMVETRPEAPHSCVRCGECLAGCFRGAIFSTRHSVAAMIGDRRVELVRGTVRAFDPKTRTLTLEGGGLYGPFDRLYLAAGCPNTTEITLRSLGLREASEMLDNAVYAFPVLHFGRTDRPRGREPHLALSNLLIGLMPIGAGLPFAQAQLYPNFDYMWRYNAPPALWPLARRLVSWSRDRIFWARLYLHGGLSQSYSVGLKNDGLRFAFSRPANRQAVARLWPALRHAVSHHGFYVPPVAPLYQDTNSHYASTLPLGGTRVPVSMSGEVARGIVICDSASFPDLPAVSLTFTIMAHAHRLATQSL